MVIPIEMGWRHVLFANWPVNPEVIDTRLPASLNVDTYDNRAWLSVVPFTNVHVRPRSTPQSLGIRLPELNLRTYVTYGDSEGVYFFSLDADRRLTVLAARWFHHVPYYFAHIDLDADDTTVRFRCQRRHPGARPVEVSARYDPIGDPFEANPSTLAAFLSQRYRFFTEAPDGRLRTTEVTHDTWPLFEVDAEIDAAALFRANGFAPPDSTVEFFYSPGVDTIASPSQDIN